MQSTHLILCHSPSEGGTLYNYDLHVLEDGSSTLQYLAIHHRLSLMITLSSSFLLVLRTVHRNHIPCIVCCAVQNPDYCFFLMLCMFFFMMCDTYQCFLPRFVAGMQIRHPQYSCNNIDYYPNNAQSFIELDSMSKSYRFHQCKLPHIQRFALCLQFTSMLRARRTP